MERRTNAKTNKCCLDFVMQKLELIEKLELDINQKLKLDLILFTILPKYKKDSDSKDKINKRNRKNGGVLKQFKGAEQN